MKTFTPSITAALLALATATPLAGTDSKRIRQFEDIITFIGAGPDPPTYTIAFLADGSSVAMSA